jgi:thymidylate kinase
MFYTIEGIDGAGCGTIRRALEKRLTAAKIKFTSLKYPVPSLPFGDVIYQFLDGKIQLPTEIQFMAFAGQMVIEKDRLKKLRKQVLLVDRYLPCTLVFQGAKGFPVAKGLEFAKIFEIEKPDKIFYLKVPWKVGYDRKNAEPRQSDLHEKDTVLYRKTANLYNRLAKDKVLGRWQEIDATRSVDEIADEIFAIIQKERKK